MLIESMHLSDSKHITYNVMKSKPEQYISL